jgi:hypothetical protein
MQAFLTLLIGCLMSHSSDVSSPADSVSARIALVALKALVYDRPLEGEAEYIIFPDGTPKSALEAAKVLAHTPKPLDCIGNRSGNQVLVTCVPMSGDRLHRFLTPSAEAAHGFALIFAGKHQVSQIHLSKSVGLTKHS